MTETKTPPDLVEGEETEYKLESSPASWQEIFADMQDTIDRQAYIIEKQEEQIKVNQTLSALVFALIVLLVIVLIIWS